MSNMKRLVASSAASLLTFAIGVAVAAAWMSPGHPAPPVNAELIGNWVTDPDDTESLYKHGRVSLEFTADGRCIFRRFPAWINKTPLLVGRVRDGLIVTDRHSGINVEKIKYTLTPEDGLTLRFGSLDSRYVREGQGRAIGYQTDHPPSH